MNDDTSQPGSKPAAFSWSRLLFRGLRVILIAVLGTYLLMLVLLWALQDTLLYQPKSELFFFPEQPYQEVSIASGQNQKLHGWWVPATGPARGTALFCHGNAGNISDRLDTLQILRNQLSLNILIFDYRGYGKSPGSPSEQGLKDDAAAAWKYLTLERGVAPDTIVIWGRSLGGAVAVHLASNNRPGALIIESSFTSMPDLASILYPYMPVRLLCRNRFESEKIIGSIKCPVLIAHSPQDELVPYKLGQRLFLAAPEPKRFLQLQDDHNNGFLRSVNTYVPAINTFLNDSLKPSGGG
jgi:uncharacterized protein